MGLESGKRTKPESDPALAAKGEAIGQDAHEVFNTVVGEGIRRARLERSWTQALLAERSGLSPNYVARLERGELGPSFFVATRLCAALDIALEELILEPGAVASRKTPTKRRG